MFLIFVSLFLSSVYLFSLGAVGNKIFFSKKLEDTNNYYEVGLIGIILASIIAFILNFFISLNKFLNDFIFLLPIILILLKKFNRKLDLYKFFSFIFLSSIVGTILISYDNVYRPDAGLYHLPFISILNENKIIIGLSNLHFRFGHISIVQYLSASFNNHLFNEKGILIPHALIFSFFLLFLIQKIFSEKNKIILIIIFSFFSFIVFRMNRYSSFGNDAPSHFYYMYLVILSIYFIFDNKNYFNKFNKIILVAIFVYFNKITMLMSLFIPLIFLLNKNFFKIILDKVFILLVIIFFIWSGKNILISGCFAFPLEQTCLKSLYWFDKSETRRSNAKSGRVENEAWTKGAPNQSEKNFSEFISSYDWIKVWKDNHGVKIMKKISPFLLFMFLIFSFLIFKEKKINYYNKIQINKKLYLILLINLIGSILWFIKFPVFRYGYGYLISSFSFLYSFAIISFIDLNIDNFKKYFKVILVVLLIGIALKSFARIYNNIESKNSAWPSIYTDEKIDKKYNIYPIYLNNKVVFYKPSQSMCYFTNKTPCTHLVDNEFKATEINLNIFNGYKIYFFK